MDFATGFFLFLFGCIFGSFLNVCIQRWPREESVVKPVSHCPHCKHAIAWYDNVPLASYILLLGKCRACRKRISPRYFLVELFSGSLGVLLWRAYGLSPWFWAGALLISILFAVSVTDLETGYIPDNFTFSGMAAGLLLCTLFPSLAHETVWFRGFFHSLGGLLAGGGVLFGIGLLGNWLFKKESMGGGDIKLLAMIGAFVGFKKVIFVLLYAPMVSLPVVIWKIFRKEKTIPFGPFLAATGAWFFIYGDQFLSRYFFYD